MMALNLRILLNIVIKNRYLIQPVKYLGINAWDIKRNYKDSPNSAKILVFPWFNPTIEGPTINLTKEIINDP